MNDVNYDIDRSKDIIYVFNQISTYRSIDNLIKCYRAFRVLGENILEKI